MADKESSSKASGEDTFQQGLERARELNEQIMEAARKAGEEFLERYVSWLEAVANEQQKLALSPQVSEMDWLAGMLNAQADFTRKFASSVQDLTDRAGR